MHRKTVRDKILEILETDLKNAAKDSSPLESLPSHSPSEPKNPSSYPLTPISSFIDQNQLQECKQIFSEKPFPISTRMKRRVLWTCKFLNNDDDILSQPLDEPEALKKRIKKIFESIPNFLETQTHRKFIKQINEAKTSEGLIKVLLLEIGTMLTSRMGPMSRTLPDHIENKSRVALELIVDEMVANASYDFKSILTACYSYYYRGSRKRADESFQNKKRKRTETSHPQENIDSHHITNEKSEDETAEVQFNKEVIDLTTVKNEPHKEMRVSYLPSGENGHPIPLSERARFSLYQPANNYVAQAFLNAPFLKALLDLDLDSCYAHIESTHIEGNTAIQQILIQQSEVSNQLIINLNQSSDTDTRSKLYMERKKIEAYTNLLEYSRHTVRKILLNETSQDSDLNMDRDSNFRSRY